MLNFSIFDFTSDHIAPFGNFPSLRHTSLKLTLSTTTDSNNSFVYFMFPISLYSDTGYIKYTRHSNFCVNLSCSTVRRTTCTHGVGCKGMIHYRCYLPVYQISPLLPLVCFLRPNTCMPALGCDCHTVEHERLNLHPTNSFCV